LQWIQSISIDTCRPPGKKKVEEEAKTQSPPPEKEKTDYTALRKLRVNGNLKVGELKVKNTRMQNLDVTLSGENGVFILKPVNLNLYKGTVEAEGSLNVVRDVPGTEVKIQSQGIEVSPLLNDVFEKDILEGTLLTRLDLTAQGDEANGIKRTLNGTGELIFSQKAQHSIYRASCTLYSHGWSDEYK
jgi:AsmA protein